jgi:hypothetical protein
MPNKTYNVIVTLPDLAAAHAEQEAKIESSSWPAALKLACDEISRRPHIKGKHIRSAKIYLSVADSKSEAGAEATRYAADREAGGFIQEALFEV